MYEYLCIMGKVILTSVSEYMHCQHLLANLICFSQKNKFKIYVETTTSYIVQHTLIAMEEEAGRGLRKELPFYI